MQVVDNRVETEVALNRRAARVAERVLPALQRLRSSGAFEQREDRLCIVRQLSKLLRLPYEKVYSDFDAICPKNWKPRALPGPRSGVLRLAPGAAAVHRQLLQADARLLQASRQKAAAHGLLHLPRSRLLLPQRLRRVLLQRRAAGPAQLLRRSARVHRAPLPGLEAVTRGDPAGHFWCEDVRVVWAELLGQGTRRRSGCAAWWSGAICV